MSNLKMHFGIAIGVILVITSAFSAPHKQAMASSTASPDELVGLLPICQQDSHFNDCLKNATEILKQKVAEGIPELNIPSLEPLKVPTIKLEQTTEHMTYKAILMDVHFYGLTDYEFTDVDADMENLTITLTAKFNHVYIDTEYMLLGKFEMLPIEGSGRLMANFTDNKAEIRINGALVHRKGQDYFMAKDTEVQVTVGGAESNFENLFTGGDMKSQITDHIIKMHSEDIIKELKPAVETVISMLIDDVAGKFFRSLPYEKLFPH